MFLFFRDKRYFPWSIFGTLLIILTTWYKVELDVKINEWFGSFYDMIQEILASPGKYDFNDFLLQLLEFSKIAAIYIIIAVLIDFFIQHYVFRWRISMNNYYLDNWEKIKHIEGSSQRVQEDVMRFAKIIQDLGLSFLKSLLTLLAFLPILWHLSKDITELPIIGHVDHALIYIAILSALFGTVLIALAGKKLPGLEFNNQKVEAAYRKKLVLAEDDINILDRNQSDCLFNNVRQNYYILFFHYLYFDVVKWSYLQFSVIIPYIALGPSIIAGSLTLGVMQQIIRAFSKVEESFQYLVRSWSVIIELISIYKRLSKFEKEIRLV